MSKFKELLFLNHLRILLDGTSWVLKLFAEPETQFKPKYEVQFETQFEAQFKIQFETYC